MSFKILKLAKEGDASKECLLLEATAPVNLSDYAVVDRTFNADGTVSNLFKHFFRFPTIPVKKGEHIALFTGKGTNGKVIIKDTGKLVHKVFWESDAPVWNDANTESVEILQVTTVLKQTTGNPAPKKKTTIKKPGTSL